MLRFEFRHARDHVSENFPKWEGRSCDRQGLNENHDPIICYRTNMSTLLSVPSSSKKRKRPIMSNQGKGEGSGGPDPEDLEIRPPSAPPLRVRSDGRGEKYFVV